jgi:hypothetical protein
MLPVHEVSVVKKGHSLRFKYRATPVVNPVNLLDVIVFAGEGLPGDCHHADRVYVDILVKMLSGKSIIARLQRRTIGIVG